MFDLYVTGRDDRNRSRIGVVTLNMDAPDKILRISKHPVLELGEPGTFDENGTSYPCLVRNGGELYLFYTGWMPTVLTPFQNHVGLARQVEEGKFERISRAPILERTNDDPISTGGVFVRIEESTWRMWYTSFLRWGRTPGEAKHTYVIKYAHSKTGFSWERPNKICIGLEHENESSICRPSVMFHGGEYHMWYCYKGERYKIGYACSRCGINWTRLDDKVGIAPSASGWDSEEMAYPHVFGWNDRFYMLYCGNNYGKEGLGIARLLISQN